MKKLKTLKWLVMLVCALSSAAAIGAEPVTLLNVSYDPTRELYEAYNPLFIQYWKQKTGQDVRINQSHGGSATQARSVMEGLRADVVTLALGSDIDAIAGHNNMLPADWQAKFPDNSAPYTSAIVFLVRTGNPKHIKDWDDLVQNGIQVITPNPKTSGGARWNYMAAWGYALKKNNNDEAAAKAYVAKLFAHVPMLDTGARGAAATFVQRGQGDVLLAWENEALLITHEMAKGEFEIVYPSITIKAEPPVAVVEKNAAKKGTLEVAKAYLDYLYSPPAQDVIAQHYYRPTNSDVAAKYASLFPALNFMNIADFGGWKTVQEKHFAESGIFDQIYMK